MIRLSDILDVEDDYYFEDGVVYREVDDRMVEVNVKKSKSGKEFVGLISEERYALIKVTEIQEAYEKEYGDYVVGNVNMCNY